MRKLSSTLYRQLDGLNLTDLDVEEVQKRELDEAKEYTDETDELEILIEIQHFGGKTNLMRLHRRLLPSLSSSLQKVLPTKTVELSCRTEMGT